jgi:hypothetical protein
MSGAEVPASLANGALWHEFCDDLKRAGEQVLAADTPVDELTRVEGYRYLTRLLRLGLEKYIEFGDPDFPEFYSLSHETAKIGNDNPDNFYLNCAVDGGRDYRITGNRGTVAYLSIETKAGSFAGGGDMAPTGHVDVDQLDVAADLRVVPQPRGQHPGVEGGQAAASPRGPGVDPGRPFQPGGLPLRLPGGSLLGLLRLAGGLLGLALLGLGVRRRVLDRLSGQDGHQQEQGERTGADNSGFHRRLPGTPGGIVIFRDAPSTEPCCLQR